MRNVLVSLFLTAMLSCAPLSFSWAPTLPLKERFMQLSFWGTGQTLFFPFAISRTGVNSGALYKKNARISVFGNAATEYRKEIDKAIDFYRPYFDLEVTFGYDQTADILLDISTSSVSERWQMLLERRNRSNKILHDILGVHLTYDPKWSSISYRETDQYIPYKIDNEQTARMVTNDARCIAFPTYRKLEDQRKYIWSGLRNAALGGKLDKLPDVHIIHIFAGLTEASKAERRDAVNREARVFIPLCLHEELGHALTGWIDVPDPNRVYFSNAYYSGGDYKKFAAKAKSELGELRKMLEVYNDPALEPMMGYDEVEKIVERHFQD